MSFFVSVHQSSKIRKREKTTRGINDVMKVADTGSFMVVSFQHQVLE
ncbi:hypothetical protein HGO53_07210 [Wolbachia endosymbiont of Diaphorina citri]|nr:MULTISPECIES: hypothetical protein [unclassified Wolbachia]QLG97090.1 hypothetical protein HGO49_07255 [Wolbachia endosymbiont of Diaphorina citri]QLH01826.1 hypothetical protein HGO53_07210 [Wolbachia endosymbiont of Diaphorina citri]QXY87009.1 hypothetical protein GZ064_03520 [Wolbachia endosymbiont of Diaphorina citri]